MTRGYFFREDIQGVTLNQEIEIEVYDEGDTVAELTIYKNGSVSEPVQMDRKCLKDLIQALEAARDKLPRKKR